jgi:hypothetical protein
MIGTFDFEAFTVVDVAGDVEDHGVVEEVGAGESEAMVAVGLGEMGIMLVIVCVCHIVIGFRIERLFYFITKKDIDVPNW